MIKKAMPQPEVFQKFSTNLKAALESAVSLAKELGQSSIRLEFLVWAILNRGGSIAGELLIKHGLNADKVKSWIIRRIIHLSQSNAVLIPSPTQILDEETATILERAALLANMHAHKYIGTEHVLSAILHHCGNSNGPTTTLLQEHAVPIAGLQEDLKAIIKTTSKFPDLVEHMNFLPSAHANHEDHDHEAVTPALDFFTNDLTSSSTAQTLDPVIGREVELERVIQILIRRTKNNPVLLGDPGVGKTAIVEGLAKRITSGDIPPVLLGKRILALDLAVMVAGSMFRGEFEARLKQVMDEVAHNENIILFIDELHTVVGAGSASGSLDAANILKPALARGEIRCIGATTFEEYKRSIEKDGALSRRFQPVMVEEPTREQSIAILKGLSSAYQAFHHVRVTDEAIHHAVDLSARYIPDRKLPDKAIDLIDEALATVRVNEPVDPLEKRLQAFQSESEKLRSEKHEALRQEQFDRAVDLRAKELELHRTVHVLKEKITKRSSRITASISGETIAGVVSRWTGIPLDHLIVNDSARLRRVIDALSSSIIGQETAVAHLSAALWRAMAGLHDDRRPIATVLLAGPTGVGKTETAVVLAKSLYADKQDAGLIRIDMSEYREPHTISKLIGSPAGYVGYRESGILTQRISQRPYSVVLFDEVEKAHPDVIHLLLQILEDGRLTDGTGRTVSFQQAIIILTTNIGSETLLAHGIQGFSPNAIRGTLSSSEVNNSFGAALKKEFRVELLNRLDAIIIYHPLSNEHCATIARMLVKALQKRLAVKGWVVDVDEGVIEFIATQDASIEHGARHIRRNISQWIETPIAQFFFEHLTTTRFSISMSTNHPIVSSSTSLLAPPILQVGVHRPNRRPTIPQRSIMVASNT